MLNNVPFQLQRNQKKKHVYFSNTPLLVFLAIARIKQVGSFEYFTIERTKLKEIKERE